MNKSANEFESDNEGFLFHIFKIYIELYIEIHILEI